MTRHAEWLVEYHTSPRATTLRYWPVAEKLASNAGEAIAAMARWNRDAIVGDVYRRVTGSDCACEGPTPDAPESSIEWAVRWHDSTILDQVGELYARSVQRLYADRAAVVSRTVTRTQWQEVPNA